MKYKLERDMMEANRFYIYRHTEDKIEPVCILYEYPLARWMTDELNRQVKEANNY